MKKFVLIPFIAAAMFLAVQFGGVSDTPKAEAFFSGGSYPDIQRCLTSAWYRLVAPCPEWTHILAR